VFSDAMLDAYIELKMGEVTRARVEVTPTEFDLYFSN
jgi:glutamine synthetase